MVTFACTSVIGNADNWSGTISPAISHRPGEIGVSQKRCHSVGERLRVAGLNQHAGLTVAHDLANTSRAGRDHGPALDHRLETNHAERLPGRGHDSE